MNNQIEFQKKLGQVLELAIEKGNKLSQGEIVEFFQEDKLTVDQLNLVYDYLLAKKVAVVGYAKEVMEEESKVELSQDEIDYLSEYETDLAAFKAEQEGELSQLYKQIITGDDLAKRRLTEIYLPRIINLAKDMHTGEMFLGDLIQEGNVSLMISLESLTEGLIETEGGIEGYLNTQIKQGVQMLLEETSDLRSRDQKMVQQVMDLDESITKLTEDLGRKVTIEELALYTEVSEDEIMEILKLTGEEVEEAPEVDITVQ